MAAPVPSLSEIVHFHAQVGGARDEGVGWVCVAGGEGEGGHAGARRGGRGGRGRAPHPTPPHPHPPTLSPLQAGPGSAGDPCAWPHAMAPASYGPLATVGHAFEAPGLYRLVAQVRT
jgi:hypothetical protein